MYTVAIDLANDKSETSVHFLILWGQYLQGTQRPSEAWAVQGLTVKAAFQLGLHTASRSTSLTPLEREIRKRTWLGVVLLDRSVVATRSHFNLTNVSQDYGNDLRKTCVDTRILC